MILKTIKPEKKEEIVHEEAVEQIEKPGEENKITNDRKLNHIIRFISTIVVIVIVVIGILISVDYVCVNKYHVGPYFAIKTKTYKDGGTKVYTGLGYKVIKYNQEVGRKDVVYGSWGLKYQTNPTKITALDLALEFRNDYKAADSKYKNQFLKIEGNVYKVDKKNNKITLRYQDEDKAYTLKIICKMASTDNQIEMYSNGDNITVIGTVKEFKYKDAKSPNKIYLKDCFAE